MIASTQNGRSRKNLADQIDRLDHMLDGLAEGLNDAVASVVQQVVGQAVHEAVAAVLTEVLTNPELRQHLAGIPTAEPQAPEASAPSILSRLVGAIAAKVVAGTTRCSRAVSGTFQMLAYSIWHIQASVRRGATFLVTASARMAGRISQRVVGWSLWLRILWQLRRHLTVAASIGFTASADLPRQSLVGLLGRWAGCLPHDAIDASRC